MNSNTSAFTITLHAGRQPLLIDTDDFLRGCASGAKYTSSSVSVRAGAFAEAIRNLETPQTPVLNDAIIAHKRAVNILGPKRGRWK